MSVNRFVYEALPTRVVFGVGTLQEAPAEAQALGMSRALVLSTPEQTGMAEEVARLLGDRTAGLYARATMHTPVTVTEDAMKVAAKLDADGLVAIGGGSTTGLGKAIALRTDLPQLVIPTTYAGSEMTDIVGQTEDGTKTTQRGPKIQPESVIYDVNLTVTLPTGLSGTSGMNAIAHAVEALYARDGNPIVSMMASEGIRALASGLPKIQDAPNDIDARSECLYGAWLCAVCLGSTSVALHHKLCHTLGGMFDLPHAETHTAVLPHALSYNAPAVPEAMAALSAALDTADPARALFELAETVGATMALGDLGMPEEGIADAVRSALENPYWNPRELDVPGITEIVTAAWRGIAPRTS